MGSGGTIISSPGGATWDVQSSGTTSNLNCVLFAGGQFYCVGDGGFILTALDGSVWSPVDSGTTATLNSIAAGSGSGLDD